ncbi:Ig-like domain-containing protein [Thermophagus sp. OGC60D27]|uniref:Ig-like domain-containing protein n=1 Tax=Thermophagus sp. OGC60D27 TaxID=3458415 RepID=UPI004037BF3F
MIKNIFFVLLSVSLIGIWGCANQGYPEGGPKDEMPPRMIASDPPLNATNFSGDKIEIEFNELIVLKDALQKVVISPPLNQLPIVRGLGNKVTVAFDEELQPATTYTIDFSDAIQDNNEGNPLTGFTFSFSTGDTQDSLQVSGQVLEAHSHLPVEGVLVMAHSNLADTAFTKTVPVRVAKTNEKGEFIIRNLAQGKYRIFALEDMNRDYKFDQPGERIAWHPEVVEPSFEWRTRPDSIFKDSLTLDTVLFVQELAYLPDSLNLFLFQEDYEEQYLDSRERDEPHRLDFVFNRPLRDTLRIHPVDGPAEKEDWFIYERSIRHDTVYVWMTDSSFITRDSLMVEAVYQVRDSLNNFIDRMDTLKMFYRQKTETEGRRRREKDKPQEPVIEPLRVQTSDGTLNIGADVFFNFPVPLTRILADSITLSQLTDTIYQPVPFDIAQDSLRIRHFSVLHQWMPGAEYRLDVDSAAFVGIYGRVNAPFSYSFKIKPEDNYGTLYVSVLNVGEDALLQLLNSKEEVVRKSNVPDNGKLAFRFVSPGEYFLRIVDDRNGNGKWDTGDFKENNQPESVHYYPEKIKMRANWDQMVNWDLNQFSVLDFVNRNRIQNKKGSSGTRR